MYSIYIVEDDKGIADAISENLKTWGFGTKCAEKFDDIISEFIEYAPHLVLMDISLPFYNGYHWCNEIRKLSKVPIIFISSTSDNMNIVMAMNMGADDFISKPFDQSVLTAKIQAMLRRSYSFVKAADIVEHRGVILNMSEGSLSFGDKKVDLTKNELKILSVLMMNKGDVISREKLMEHLWKTDSFIDENTLTVNVGRIRKKLYNIGLTEFISTKFGVGYYIKGED